MKKGKIPSLLSGSAGRAEKVVAGRKRPCKRCSLDIDMGSNCYTVRNPRSMSGGNTYCLSCFKDVLDQTEKDLNLLRVSFSETAAPATTDV